MDLVRELERRPGKNKKRYYDVTVIIPTLNEEANIGQLIKDIFREYPAINIIVSDDGSTDKTKEIVMNMPFCKFIDRSDKDIKGLTISVIDAVKQVKSNYCVIIDGDGQHPYMKIGEMVEKIRNGCEIVVGTRTSVPGWAFNRRVMSIGASYLGNLCLRLRRSPKCTDVMSGFFAIDKELFITYLELKYHRFELRGYKVLFDLLKVLPKHIVIDKVEYEFGARTGGTSKINKNHIKLYFWSLFK